MTPEEEVTRDANLAASYYRLLVFSHQLERSEAISITQTYVMSKVSQQTMREERDARDANENKKEVEYSGMQRGPAGRAHFTGQHLRVENKDHIGTVLSIENSNSDSSAQ